MGCLCFLYSIADLNSLDLETFLAQVAERVDVQPSDQPVKPAEHGLFEMYLKGQWYQLKTHSNQIPQNDPVGQIDASLLAWLAIC